MKIVKTQNGENMTLSLSGRLDTHSAPQLHDVLIPALDTVKTVTLDFAELAYVSSAGLRALLLGEKTAQAKGGKQTLVNVSDEIMEVFEITGFSEILNFA